MPPVVRIKREDIIEAGYNLARKKGLEGINAREIAKKLNCSVQPIFHNFSNMEELKEQIFEKILATYRKYLTTKTNNENEYKQMGMGYIRFAKEEPTLFRAIFMKKTDLSPEKFISYDTSFKVVEEAVQNRTNFKQEKAKQFHIKMWIFTHGLATIIANKTCELTDEQISKLLSDEYFALIKLEE